LPLPHSNRCFRPNQILERDALAQQLSPPSRIGLQIDHKARDADRQPNDWPAQRYDRRAAEEAERD
jgi:hypothetical protein